MSFSLGAGIVAALVALIAGWFIGTRKAGGLKAIEFEHKVEVERQTLDKGASDEHSQKTIALESEIKKLAGKAPSDVLSDMIGKGEVSR